MKEASLRMLCALVLGSVALGCSKESSTTEASQQPAAANSIKPQDKLAQALASAIEPSKAGAAPNVTSDSAPPADGVLEPGKADTISPAHSAPKISLGSTGQEPRLKLAHRPFAAPMRSQLQIAVDMGNGQGLPPVDFKLEIRPAGAAADTQVQNMTVRVLSADIAAPDVPQEFKSQLRQLKGSKFSLKVAGNGGAFDCMQDASSNKNEGLGQLLEMVGQGILDAAVAMPDEGVGSGAYWMTTSRQRMFGMDWITYDMVKVAELTTTDAKLEITTRRYAVGRELAAPAQAELTAKLTIREAMATGNTQATASISGNLLSSYERSSSVRILMDGADDRGQRVLQTGGQTKFAIAH
jgi:hypothetical protein